MRPFLSAALVTGLVALPCGRALAQDPPPVWPPPGVVPVQPYPAPESYPAPAPIVAQPLAPWPPPAYVQPAPDRASGTPSNWYGWQTLIAVLPFDVTMIAGRVRFADPAGQDAFAVGLAGRTLAPAVVHMAHGRVGTGFASIGLHAATTATGVAIGYGIGIALEARCAPPDPCRNHFLGVPEGPDVGAMAGSMVGTVLDVVFFAHRQRLSWTASAAPAPAKPVWAVAPYAAQKSAGLAAAGMF